MSVIFPGNYVAHLNAYRDQGVFALPGVEFYQLRGLAYVTEDQTGGGTLALVIPSPDLRQDDKPRLDKPFVVPAGSTVYRTAVSTSNLSGSGTDTVSVSGLTTTAGTQAVVTAVDGVFPVEGGTTTFDGFTTQSVEATDTTISAAFSGELNIVNPDDQAVVMVEVCFYMDADGPEPDDYHIAYKTEAGQGY